jgi:hypothetical protein
MNNYSISQGNENNGFASIQKGKVVYKSKIFIGILIAYLLYQIIGKSVVIYHTGELLKLIPIIFYGVVLSIVASKHKWARVAIKCWAIVMILGFAELLVGIIYNIAAGQTLDVYTMIPSMHYVYIGIQLVIGCTYLFLTDRYIDKQ